MVHRLLYFTKNATTVDDSFKQLAVLFVNIEYSWSKQFSVVEYSVTEIPTGDIPNKDKDKDLFIGPQEFVAGYSKAPEQPQSSARPTCHSHAITRTGLEPATIRIAA